MGTPSSYSITTVCRLTGLSSRTLRHWERLGLLTPVQVDRRGFRHYGADNLSVVLHLMLLRTLGLPLPDRATWREVPPGWDYSTMSPRWSRSEPGLLPSSTTGCAASKAPSMLSDSLASYSSSSDGDSHSH